MGGARGDGWSALDDPLVAALTLGGADRPESRVLDPLVGHWRTHTEWEPTPGKGVRHSDGTMDAAWVLEGRAMELQTFQTSGREVARVLLAFDPSAEGYVAFSVTVLSSFFEMERGTYSAADRVLALDGREPAPALGIVIDYRRSFRFLDADTFTVDISYPGAPPGIYGPMLITHRREA